MKNHTFADIIETRAWQDDDQAEDIDGGWQIEHLWMYGTLSGKSSYTTCDSDGNHEPCSRRDADEFSRDAEQSWKDYAAWVIENGTDPLGNYRIERETKRIETWTARVRKSIGYKTRGLTLISARRMGGKRIRPCDLPQHVFNFLELKRYGPNYCLDGIHELSDLIETKYRDHGAYATLTFKVDRVTPRNERVVRRELITLAKRGLQPEGNTTQGEVVAT